MQGWVRIFVPSLFAGLTFAGEGELTSVSLAQATFLARELGGVDLGELEGLLRAQAYLVLRFEPREEAVPFQKYDATLLDTVLTAESLVCRFQIRTLSL